MFNPGLLKAPSRIGGRKTRIEQGATKAPQGSSAFLPGLSDMCPSAFGEEWWRSQLSPHMSPALRAVRSPRLFSWCFPPLRRGGEAHDFCHL